MEVVNNKSNSRQVGRKGYLTPEDEQELVETIHIAHEDLSSMSNFEVVEKVVGFEILIVMSIF